MMPASSGWKARSWLRNCMSVLEGNDELKNTPNNRWVASAVILSFF